MILHFYDFDVFDGYSFKVGFINGPNICGPVFLVISTRLDLIEP